MAKPSVQEVLQARFSAHKKNVEACRYLRQNFKNEEIVDTRLSNMAARALTQALEVSSVADELDIPLDGLEGFILPATDRTGDK